MASPTPAKPTPTASIRIALATEAAQSKEAFTRLQAEYEGLVADPDVIQEDRSTAHVLAEQARHSLASARAALARFDSGTYGICTECGGQITAARMEAIPDAATCRDCS